MQPKHAGCCVPGSTVSCPKSNTPSKPGYSQQPEHADRFYTRGWQLTSGNRLNSTNLMKGCTQQSAMQPSGPDTINPDSRDCKGRSLYAKEAKKKRKGVYVAGGLASWSSLGKKGNVTYQPG